MDNKNLWQAVLGEFEVTLSKGNFITWFMGTSLQSSASGRFVIVVPSIYNKENLEKRFHVDIKAALGRLGGGVTSVQYVVVHPSSNAKEELLDIPTSGSGDVAKKPEPKSDTGLKPLAQTPKNVTSRYSFDNFIVGSSNELAYAASQAVVKFPGTKYNPLFIYGGVGLGKTHLMQAIGAEIVRKEPTKKIAYVTSEEFTNEFLVSLTHKRTQDFANKYRKVDVLIVDDIQFLGSKERTQEEFFHTFNALYETGKQIILSSDKQPQAIPGLEDRLKSRFAMGMMADISAPDLETRSVILQRKAAIGGVILSLDVIDYIAKHMPSNIRELEGGLTRYLAFLEHHKLEPSVATATEIFGSKSSSKNRSKAATPKAVIDKVATYFDLSSAEIIGTKRDKEIVVPRQIAMYLMRHELNLSFPKIAQVVGGRDHTTAMHSVTKIEHMSAAS